MVWPGAPRDASPEEQCSHGMGSHITPSHARDTEVTYCCLILLASIKNQQINLREGIGGISDLGGLSAGPFGDISELLSLEQLCS